MEICLDLGRAAAERGETPVGALVARGAELVAKAEEATRRLSDVTAHAEVLAIRQAALAVGSIDLEGCDLYTTVEPCVLCSYAIRRSGIARVVYGAPAGTLGGVSSTHAILVEPSISGFAAPPVITKNVRLGECLALLADGRRG